jgi:hypothetical protein
MDRVAHAASASRRPRRKLRGSPLPCTSSRTPPATPTSPRWSASPISESAPARLRSTGGSAPAGRVHDDPHAPRQLSGRRHAEPLRRSEHDRLQRDLPAAGERRRRRRYGDRQDGASLHGPDRGGCEHVRPEHEPRPGRCGRPEGREAAGRRKRPAAARSVGRPRAIPRRTAVPDRRRPEAECHDAGERAARPATEVWVDRQARRHEIVLVPPHASRLRRHCTLIQLRRPQFP